ncbi:hypothetical protein BV22DRAFT_1041460 [Leucogyrophana mollusca]|uniref:Uncharacterized protein n=1 Tax=Leucogyrophana mollusca TaxID=85980 RepID=A0ACB8B0Y2_9AGAM|nr:hypothetical protein BV22DRAFT_1041460 [Leucogyrophana mollusca]
MCAYFGFSSHIPRASFLPQVIRNISNHHVNVYFVAFTALVLQSALSVWSVFTTIAT